MYKDIDAANGHINAFGIDLSKNALSSHSSFGRPCRSTSCS